MKDFFDIWTLATTQRFEASRLSRSIRATFERRHTAIPAETPLALTEEFLLDPTKGTQWKAFCRRLNLRDTPSLDAIGPTLIQFLLPAIEQANQQQPAKLIWHPPGPWL